MADFQQNTLSQALDIKGSENQDSSMNLSDEPLGLGTAIIGQSGVIASITVGAVVVVSGLTGMSADSIGRFLTISGAANANNNGSFLIDSFNNASSVNIINALAATDANNGAISWIERNPYSLEDDINYIRTDRANIKSAIGIISGETDVDNELTDRGLYYPFSELPINPTVVDALNVLNREIGDRDYTGAILVDGYTVTESLQQLSDEISNVESAIGIISGETNIDNELTNKGIYFPFSELPVDPTVIDALNVLNREIGDRNYTGAILTDGYTITQSLQQLANGASGISPTTHASLRQLIHLSEYGPFEEFASGAYKEITGGVFPTSEIWWESSAKLEKIVEKTITRNPNKTPSVIEWKVYDEDGVTVMATATDTISYSGITETSRTRVIS
jgi:hypothetical protein